MTEPRAPITPWNPSRSATARVKNPLPLPGKCPNCGSPVFIDSNSCIYGKEHGKWPWALMCTGCDSYVGLHPFTGIPQGTMARPEVRAARKQAKAAFNPLWEVKGAPMTRTAALGIENVEDCHIGWFGVDQCRAVIAAVRARGPAPQERHTCHWPGCNREVPAQYGAAAPTGSPCRSRCAMTSGARTGRVRKSRSPLAMPTSPPRAVQQWIAEHQEGKTA